MYGSCFQLKENIKLTYSLYCLFTFLLEIWINFSEISIDMTASKEKQEEFQSPKK